MQEIMLFEDTQVEVLEIHSVIYFNPYHVAKCLGLTDSAVRKAVSKMTKNQAITLKNSDVKDIPIRKLNNRGELFLTESGVYKLAFKSNKPNAEVFTNWIADEVLPTIRKTGRYELPTTQSPNPLLEQNILNLQRDYKIVSNYILEHAYEIGSLIDKVDYLNEQLSPISNSEITPYRYQLLTNAVELNTKRLYALEWDYMRQKQITEMLASDDTITSQVGKALMKSTEDYKAWIKKSVVEISCKRQVNTMCVYRELYNMLDICDIGKRWRNAIKNDGHILYKTFNQHTLQPTRAKLIRNIFEAVCYCGKTDTYELKDLFTRLVVEQLVQS